MKITSNFVSEAVGCDANTGDTYAPLLQTTCVDYAIDKPLRLAAFLAQTGHESRGFEVLRESLNYTSQSLINLFGRNRITKDAAIRFGRTDDHRADQEVIGNIIYGGPWGARNLGNTEPGDGWKFRGVGLIQLTGRANIRRLTKRLRAKYGDHIPDFEQSPELLTQPRWAVLSAADYWDSHDLNDLADDPSQFEALTAAINAGLVGLVDRVARWRGAQTAIAKFGVF